MNLFYPKPSVEEIAAFTAKYRDTYKDVTNWWYWAQYAHAAKVYQQGEMAQRVLRWYRYDSGKL